MWFKESDMYVYKIKNVHTEKWMNGSLVAPNFDIYKSGCMNLPRKGMSSDTWGVLSDRIRRNTENDSRIVIDSDSFSPQSTGTKNVNAERNARTTVGIMMLSK